MADKTGFTNKGYIKRTAEQIKSSMLDRIVRTNPTFNSWSGDIQSNILDTAIQPILEVENLVGDLANSYAPGYANDFMREQLASTLNLKYKDETKSKVTLKFTGDKGVFIPKGTKVLNDFLTDKAVSISTAGTAYVTASSESAETFAANTINEIKSVVHNSLAVTNPAASVPYSPEETSDELWARAQRKLRSPRKGGTEYALSEILACEGTSERLINFNFISTNTKRGVEAIIGGGDAADIATALVNSFLGLQNLVSDPSNNEADRTASWDVNYYGSVLPIVWTLPKLLELEISVQIAFRYVSVYEGRLGEAAQSLFETEINTRKVGVPISKTLLDSLVLQAVTAMGVEFQYVSRIDFTIISNGQQLRFNNENYLQGIEKDVYTSLKSFQLQVVA